MSAGGATGGIGVTPLFTSAAVSESGDNSGATVAYCDEVSSVCASNIPTVANSDFGASSEFFTTPVLCISRHAASLR